MALSNKAKNALTIGMAQRKEAESTIAKIEAGQALTSAELNAMKVALVSKELAEEVSTLSAAAAPASAELEKEMPLVTTDKALAAEVIAELEA